MRIAALALAMLALAAPAASGADAPITAARAHEAASARLLGYALSFSYVVDYGVGRCTVSGPRGSCSYHIAWYQEPACDGTILVVARRHALSTRFAPPACEPPAEATAPPTSGGPSPAPPGPPTFPAPPPASPVGTHLIAAIAADDSAVTLDDGSTWTIGAGDQAEVDTWLVGDEVDVEQVSANVYTLTDDTLDDGVAVTTTDAG